MPSKGKENGNVVFACVCAHVCVILGIIWVDFKTRDLSHVLPEFCDMNG